MGELSHLHPSKQNIATLSNDERINDIKQPRWIGYHRARAILARLDDLVIYPTCDRMPCLMVVGSTNNGKTQIAKRFARKHRPDENVGGEHILAPVLFVQAPPSPSEADFYAQILNSLYEHIPTSGTAAKRMRVLEVLRRIKVKVLVIDELHHLLAGSSVQQQKYLNMIKFLINELNISVAGFGTGDLLRAVSIDAQIENRFTPEILPRWIDDMEYGRLLKSFESIFPLRHPSILNEPFLAKTILAKTEGAIGEISNLLNSAAIAAIQSGEERISVKILNNCGYLPPSDRKKMAARV